MVSIDQDLINYLIISINVIIVCFLLAYYALKKLGKDPRNILLVNFASIIWVPLLIFMVSLFFQIAILAKLFRFEYTYTAVGHISTIGIIISTSWFFIIILKIFKARILRKYDVSTSDNLKARKVFTQFMILEKIIIFIIIVLAVGVALMSFDSIRSIGVSLLTSIGIAGIIIGLAAQKAIATLLAGIQIALAQPIRIEDVVIIEGEWVGLKKSILPML